MSKTIWKFKLGVNCVVEMPEGAEILSIEEKDSDIYLWAMVDPGAKKINRNFAVYGTGDEVKSGNDELQFIGTVLLLAGQFVFHVFEIIEKPLYLPDAGYDEVQPAKPDAKPAVTQGSLWRHRNGIRYRVLGLFNEHSEDLDKYPVIVTYVGGNGRTWARPLNDWHRSFTPAVATKHCGNCGEDFNPSSTGCSYCHVWTLDKNLSDPTSR